LFVPNIDKETEHSTPDFTLAGNVKKIIFKFDPSAVNTKNIDIMHNEESKSDSASNVLHCPLISQFLRADIYYFKISLPHAEPLKDLLNVNASIFVINSLISDTTNIIIIIIIIINRSKELMT
jgi:hypothetical protein